MGDEHINWMKQARDDLQKARDNLKTDHLDGSAFFSQQAAEKALKAVSIKKMGEFPKIHDLVALSRMVSAPEEIIEKCKVINPYYTETRYPDMGDKIPAESFTKTEIQDVIKTATEVLEWAERYLI
ncbi:HEPN domain-containing protein [Candidatus Woesearchaeota archaeon]|nr:HEPN domain-containing protein [Candidatus Woesearchaeota archaeon]